MSHLHSVIEQVLKIKKEQKSASGLLQAALIHLKNAETQASCTQALLASVCGQIETTNTRDELARAVYQFTGVW